MTIKQTVTIKVLTIAGILVMLAAVALPFVSQAAINVVTPSTNDINRTNGWAHVDEVSVGIGVVDLEFISERNFFSCFEYRTDGDISQSIGTNFNSAVTDGLYPYTCRNNNSQVLSINANEYVEVRMVFGAEGDERFDWTRFNVLSDATEKADCFDGGWEEFGFKNQGQCVRFVETGKDSR